MDKGTMMKERRFEEPRQMMKPPPSVEEELGQLVRTIERTNEPDANQHPALIACQKAAEMVRGVHERHAAEGETLAQHLEQIGEQFMQMCKQAADQVRQQRILPQEMATKMADDLVRVGQLEASRQARVAHGLTAARDAILGIDERDQ